MIVQSYSSGSVWYCIIWVQVLSSVASKTRGGVVQSLVQHRLGVLLKPRLFRLVLSVINQRKHCINDSYRHERHPAGGVGGLSSDPVPGPAALPLITSLPPPPVLLTSHLPLISPPPPSPHRLLSRVALCTEFFITGHLLPAAAKDGSRHRRQTRVPSPDTKSRNNNVILYERQQNEERTGEGRGAGGCTVSV